MAEDDRYVFWIPFTSEGQTENTMSKSKMTDEQFIRTYFQAETMAQVAEALSTSKAACTARVSAFKKLGVVLPPKADLRVKRTAETLGELLAKYQPKPEGNGENEPKGKRSRAAQMATA
jgi:hypothetical protein